MHFRYGNAETCGEEGSLDNDNWNDNFVTWGATLITFGAAAGAILAGPPLKLGRIELLSPYMSIQLTGRRS